MLLFAHFPLALQLLLLGVQPRLAGDALRQLESLCSGPMDWDLVLRAAEKHRVGPLLFHTLETLLPGRLPAPVRASLQTGATANAFHALQATHESHRVSMRFAEAGLPLVALKGVTLSQMLYGSPNVRHVGDIDLLTSPSRLADQIALFAELGFHLLNPGMRLTPRRIASFSRFWKDFTFSHPASGFELDLHWRLFNNRYHRANRLLHDASVETLPVFGLPFRVLSRCDQFLYVAAHGVSDAFTYLKSLADVAGFLRLLSPAELEQALARADTLGLLAQVSAAVHLSNAWMQTGVTSPRLLPPTQAQVRTIANRASDLLQQQQFLPDRDFPAAASWTRLELQLVPGARSLAEIVSRFAFRPRVWASIDLPDRLFLLYPLIGLLLPPRLHSAFGRGRQPSG